MNIPPLEDLELQSLRDGIDGTLVVSTDPAWQYALGKSDNQVYKRRLYEAGTYGGWEWESYDLERIRPWLAGRGVEILYPPAPTPPEQENELPSQPSSPRR